MAEFLFQEGESRHGFRLQTGRKRQDIPSSEIGARAVSTKWGQSSCFAQRGNKAPALFRHGKALLPENCRRNSRQWRWAATTGSVPLPESRRPGLGGSSSRISRIISTQAAPSNRAFSSGVFRVQGFA
jgi:hypothetical protein